MSGEPLDTAIDPKVLQDLASYFHAPSQELSNLHITSDYSMNNSSAASAAPIDMAPRVSAAGNSAQLSGSAASFGTDSYRGGLANSFHQLQQHHPSFQQQQHQSHQSGLFRQQLGSPTHAEMFSPGTDDLGDLSPGNSYPSHSLAAMASGTLPTSIPGSLLGSQQRQVAVAATDQMLRMQAFSASPPPNSPGGNFQSMSLPAHSEWFESQLGQHQNIGSALDPSSFAAQQITGTSGAEFSPQNPTLMSLVEDGDDGSQKS
ncbi:hypothetical protein GGF46_005022 [Coemansia sp. RSA 552]|nr:hypothetical protein GGF46_005022 [Coemansia sp. RSA 552]